MRVGCRPLHRVKSKPQANDSRQTHWRTASWAQLGVLGRSISGRACSKDAIMNWYARVVRSWPNRVSPPFMKEAGVVSSELPILTVSRPAVGQGSQPTDDSLTLQRGQRHAEKQSVRCSVRPLEEKFAPGTGGRHRQLRKLER